MLAGNKTTRVRGPITTRSKTINHWAGLQTIIKTRVNSSYKSAEVACLLPLSLRFKATKVIKTACTTMQPRHNTVTKVRHPSTKRDKSSNLRLRLPKSWQTSGIMWPWGSLSRKLFLRSEAPMGLSLALAWCSSRTPRSSRIDPVFRTAQHRSQTPVDRARPAVPGEAKRRNSLLHAVEVAIAKEVAASVMMLWRTSRLSAKWNKLI